MTRIGHSPLQVVTPYLVPTRPLYRTLRRLTRKGIAVTLLTNSLASTDMPLAYAGYWQRQKRLLRSGLGLHELKPDAQRTLYAKVAIFDEQTVRWWGA